MLNYDDVIEAMGKAFYNSGDNEGWVWEQEPDENKQVCRDAAKAAFKALQEMLPDGGGIYVTEPEYKNPNGTFPPLSSMKTVFKGVNEAELYQQLKNLGGNDAARI